jgi:hypothetical protein
MPFPICVFLHSSATAHIPVTQLLPEQANFRHWFYPRFEKDAPVLANSNRVVRMNTRLLDGLSNYGVRVDGRQKGVRACDR